MVKKAEKKQKQYGASVKCPKCREKLYLNDEVVISNTERVGEITFIYCECGEEVIVK